MPDVRYGCSLARCALGLLLAGVFALGCSPAPPLSVQASSPTPPAPPTGAASTPPPSAVPPAQQADLVVWIGGEGCLSTLGATGWRSFDFSGIVRDIAIDSQGNAIAAPGLRVCNGRLLRDLLPRAPGGEQDAVAIDPQGRIWAGYYGGIAMLDGGHWTEYPLPGGASVRANTVRDLAIDAQGVVWVATGEGIASYDGRAWRRHVDKPGPGAVIVDCLLIDWRGWLWAAHEKGISVLRGTAWEHFPLDIISFVRQIADDPSGRILAGGLYHGISFFDGKDWLPLADDTTGLPANRTTALAVDGRGRIWAGTRSGLAIYDEGRWLTYQEANSGLGDDRVSALAIAGLGPSALPPLAATRYGQLAGKVTLQRRPVAGVRVALCPELAAGQEFADNPCESARYGRVTRTGIDGRYLFDQVPLGHYAVAAEVEPGRWVTPMRVLSAMSYRVREGETTVAETIEGAD
ncbi:MAG TPA: two-component regulator propeller domain-containing protein [Anaerolineae bacterium]|nr:two-component regulator propeller domain-containing protein [Anaerolineae bacterium]